MSLPPQKTLAASLHTIIYKILLNYYLITKKLIFNIFRKLDFFLILVTRCKVEEVYGFCCFPVIRTHRISRLR